MYYQSIRRYIIHIGQKRKRKEEYVSEMFIFSDIMHMSFAFFIVVIEWFSENFFVKNVVYLLKKKLILLVRVIKVIRVGTISYLVFFCTNKIHLQLCQIKLLNTKPFIIQRYKLIRRNEIQIASITCYSTHNISSKKVVFHKIY